MILRSVSVLLVTTVVLQVQAFTTTKPSIFLTRIRGYELPVNTFYDRQTLASLTSLSVSRSSSSKPSETKADDEDKDDDEIEIDFNEMALEASKLTSSATTSPRISVPTDPVSKFRKLKDIMWIREAVEDVTAAEFACSVEGSSEGEKDASLRRKRKRAVDYEKMLSNLDQRVEDMIPGVDDDAEERSKLESYKGMGRFAYTTDQREELLRYV